MNYSARITAAALALALASPACAARVAAKATAHSVFPQRATAQAACHRGEVDALRGLLIGTHAHLGLDAVVLVAATVAGVTAAALLLPRLAR